MRWAFLADQRPPPIPDTVRFRHVDDLLSASPESFGPILMACDTWQDALSTAHRLRSQPRLAHRPLFLYEAPAGHVLETTAELFDGIGIEASVRAARASEILELASRQHGAATSPGEALSQFMACRPHYRLQPLKDWSAAGYYRYPLAEALLGTEENVFIWLDRWARRHIIDIDVVVDRLRICDQCSSAHINHIDICPACSSINIMNTRLLHCFTCGHVDHQEGFQHQHRLECPKCHSVLRHIGVDYDRPMEQQQCRQCKHIFVDADVRSTCMACGTSSKPEQLPVRPINAYRLGGAGLLLARQGNLSPVLSGLDMLNYIAPASFERLLDWQIALANRYPQSYFCSVIGLRITNLIQLVERIGHAGTATLIDGFAERLRATLRNTDVTTRGDDEHLWLLTPHTDEAGARLLVERIHKLTDAAQQGDDTKLTLFTAVATKPGVAELPEEASQLMGLMASRLEIEESS